MIISTIGHPVNLMGKVQPTCWIWYKFNASGSVREMVVSLEASHRATRYRTTDTMCPNRRKFRRASGSLSSVHHLPQPVQPANGLAMYQD